MADHYDVIIVGAGIGGMRMLVETRKLGLSARIVEAGEDLGGTWYWNRYPGARTDTECWYYCYSFSKEILDEWVWPERYANQESMMDYLYFVADKLDLRRDMQFNSRVQSSIYDEEANKWVVTLEGGEVLTAKYFITATGLLSAPVAPPYEGVESFSGEYYVTGQWPENVGSDFTGKRVAIIGTGATAVQAIPIISYTAEQLTVFQRTATYVLPSRNHTIEDAHRVSIHANYDDLWKQTETHPWALPYEPNMGRVAADLTPEEQQAVLQSAWEMGTFRFLFETWDDVFTNVEANEIVNEFIRGKIKSIVKDPEVAEKLTPRDHGLGAKRPPLGQFYYESFNRPNVSLVDIKESPIERITEKGILAGGVEHEFDVIIFATGFDAVTGALVRQDIRGVGGQQLAERWKGGPETYLSVAIDGFPNMFMVLGPQGPFAILTVAIEHIVQFIGKALEFAAENGVERLEAESSAVAEWVDIVDRAKDASLEVRGTYSWLWGANIPGKARVIQQYMGGSDKFVAAMRESAGSEFSGFRKVGAATASVK